MASSIRTALRALGISRLRSALTILGIAVGVAAVVAMVAIASGAKSRVAAQLSSLGANLIGVSPGSLSEGPYASAPGPVHV